MTGVSGGLDDVVLEDRGLAEGSEDGDGEDRDGDGRGYGETCAEADVDGDCSEEDAEEGAEDEGAVGEFGAGGSGGNEGLEVSGCWHVDGVAPAFVCDGATGWECISGVRRGIGLLRYSRGVN